MVGEFIPPALIFRGSLYAETSSGYNTAPAIDYDDSHVGWISPTQNEL